MKKFKAGDKVQLKIDESPCMTISTDNTEEKNIRCTWFDKNNELQSEEIVSFREVAIFRGKKSCGKKKRIGEERGC